MRLYLKRGHNLPEMWWLFIAFLVIVLLFIVLFNPLLQNSLYGSFVIKHSPIIISEDIDISSILPVKFKLTTLEAMRQAESEMSNVAAVYWYNWVNNFRQWNNSQMKNNVTYCEQVLLTSPFKVKHHNSFWQVFERSDDDEKEAIQMFLYNAYYDNRVLAGKPVVRLITINKFQLVAQKMKWSCLLWFENQTQPTLEPVTDYYNVWPDLWKGGLSDGIYGTQIIACPIPDPHLGEIPCAVSLQAQSSCDKVELNPSNVLRVIYNNPTEESSPRNNSYPSIGVCVKGLRFRTFDYSVRLVEWLEIVRILGGEKVYIYVYGVTESVYKVLRHYQAEDYVEWRHLTLPDTQPNIESLYEHYTKDELNQRFRPAQLLELNDCLYRNVHRHDFVAVFDVDELIVPQQVDNWKELISSLDKRTQQQHLGPMGFYSTLHAHVYQLYEETEYFQNESSSEIQKARPIPAFLHTMRHTHRSPTFPRTRNIKCLHRTSLVSAVHNHFPLRCLNSSAITAQQYFNCKGVSMSEQDALMMHFRSNVSLECESNRTIQNTSPEELMTNCKVHDRNMWRYFDRLEGRVRDKLWRIFSDGQ